MFWGDFKMLFGSEEYQRLVALWPVNPNPSTMPGRSFIRAALTLPAVAFSVTHSGLKILVVVISFFYGNCFNRLSSIRADTKTAAAGHQLLMIDLFDR